MHNKIGTISLMHIGLQYQSIGAADIFFRKILGLDCTREFILARGFSCSIFKSDSEVKVITCGNKNISFEIFITGDKPNTGYEHICLSVENKIDLIKKCQKYGIKIKRLRNNGKEYIFIRDFSGYIYEIK